jgi:DHA1 family bicyclomycin/chloramphenicol resistance-like MFS transporter
LSDPDPGRQSARSTLSERRLILLLGALNAAGPMTVFLYLPALPRMQAAFGVPVHIAQTTVSVALVAFASGILVSGPLSDRFGRRPLLIGGMLTFLLGSALCLAAPTLPLLVAGRAIQTLGTATGLAVSRAVVIDVFPPEKVFQMIARLTLVTIFANALSPYFGGLLVKAFDWRSVFVFLTTAGVVMTIAAWRLAPETRVHSAQAPRLLHATLDLLRRPVFVAYLAEGGVILAVYQVFVATTPYLMQNHFHRTPEEFGLFTVFVSGGYFAGNFLVTRLGARWASVSMLTTGLGMQFAFALVMLALVLLRVPGPFAIYVPMCLLALGQGLALPQINAAALTLAPRSAGLASSLIGFGQSFISGASVQLVSIFPTGAGLPMIIFIVLASGTALACLRLVPPRMAAQGRPQ